MSHELTKEDHDKMHRDTEAGIAHSHKNSEEEWRRMALDCLHKICVAKETFTVNDVRDLVQRSPLTTHDNRAMGGVIKKGLSEGWFVATGESIPSVVGHKVHIQIWKSRIYNKQMAEPPPEVFYRYEVMDEASRSVKMFRVSSTRLDLFLKTYPNAKRIAEPKGQGYTKEMLKENARRVKEEFPD